MLSPEQLQAYEDDGAVLVDLRLPPETLARLEAAWDGHSLDSRVGRKLDPVPQGFERP